MRFEPWEVVPSGVKGLPVPDRDIDRGRGDRARRALAVMFLFRALVGAPNLMNNCA